MIDYMRTLIQNSLQNYTIREVLHFSSGQWSGNADRHAGLIINQLYCSMDTPFDLGYMSGFYPYLLEPVTEPDRSCQALRSSF